ncbi:hypothetical protein NKT34_23615 [Paenibacillus polysaccharolyticus]|uniref:hypothetical protein n=1 Tax=Paenibacillus polysaccharolyticus TaxID=582692 RepID=UPI0020A1B4D6|nr:hypothetical protein [Paenibacillus polysaccharolyticus]MCP1136291.1 hypothetical protein [Paenibacillus polysaccharolyticus]
MNFEITEEMMKLISEWDSCTSADVSGAKFAYTFIPTGIGLVIQVKCDVCQRTLNLSDDL